MSRVGKHPVAIPKGVKVTVEGRHLSAEGKMGKLDRELMREVVLEREGEAVRVSPVDASARARMMWGTARTLVANMINGVSAGFTRKLEITGVGYRAQMQGDILVLQLGYSHDIRFPVPAGLTITCPDQTHIVLTGADREVVGLAASQIKAYRPIEPYKAKGIKYEGEYVLRKEGKKK
ncbi:MAG: 50S ribosomal protein L6 [Rhodospirillales bacterium]|nr:50S ribosomal protein L6 [Rhodospirillales bacterium]